MYASTSSQSAYVWVGDGVGWGLLCLRVCMCVCVCVCVCVYARARKLVNMCVRSHIHPNLYTFILSFYQWCRGLHGGIFSAHLVAGKCEVFYYYYYY